MRKRFAGVILAVTLMAGFAGPFMGTAHADTTRNNPPPTNTDPVLCFVASQAIITEALNEFHAGHLTAAQLRSVLVGTAAFLGDCLTPA